MQVKWGTNYSSPFTVQWGKARGVLSPYLFAVYLDQLSIQLGSARVACTICGKYGCESSNVCWLICVFSPSISGL